MKNIKIDYSNGGFRKASKYLTWKHNAHFSIIVDAIIYIYNENLDKLIDIEEFKAVKISNGFLSRNTGLSSDIVKRQVNKIEEIGLITAIKKGQGNTRHYVIHIDRINIYIKSLEDEFNMWFEESLENSKKEKSRSIEADQIKLQKGIKKFEKIIKKTSSGKDTNGLVQNPPTIKRKTPQPNDIKPTVVDTTVDSKTQIIETTTRSLKTRRASKQKEEITEQALNEVFNKNDDKGNYTYISGLKRNVYRNDYVSSNFTMDNDRTDQYLYINSYGFDEDPDVALKDNITSEEVPEEVIFQYLYKEIQEIKEPLEREKKKLFETTDEPAKKETSDLYWEALEHAYDSLPHLDNQGKFFTSKEDKASFYQLSEYRQEYVVSSVEDKKYSGSTASRPSIYIEEAKNGKFLRKRSHNPMYTMV